MSVEIAGKVLAEVRRRGSDAVDLRDAARSHPPGCDQADIAIVRHPGGVDRRNRDQCSRDRTDRVSASWRVDRADRGVASVALLEMGCTFGSCPPETEFISAIRSRMNAPHVIAMAERVIALGCS